MRRYLGVSVVPPAGACTTIRCRFRVWTRIEVSRSWILTRSVTRIATLGLISLLPTRGAELAAQETGCGLQVAPGVAFPVGDFAVAVDPGWAVAGRLTCAGASVGVRGGVELDYMYGPTNVLLFRVLAGPELRLPSSDLGLRVNTGAGWTFAGGWGLVIPESPPRSDLVGSGPTLTAGLNVARPLSNRVALVADAGIRVLFASTDDVEFGNATVEGFDEVLTLPLSLGLRFTF
ncbi:MAG: hypothetical protein ACRELC_01910 [Gemmatimonadota bacterium]